MATPSDLNALSIPFAEEVYEAYVNDPASVSEDWRNLFESLNLKPDRTFLRPTFAHTSIFNPPAPTMVQAMAATQAHAATNGHADKVAEAIHRQDMVDALIRNYRVRGHTIAQIDPLGATRPVPNELTPEFYGFTAADMDATVSSKTIGGPDVSTPRQILERLRNTYCRSIGVQFMHIDDFGVRTWLQQRMEANENRLQLGREEAMRILRRLTDATLLEEFIQRKFLGAKSFSLEGGETLIPLLDMIIEKSGEQRVDEIVIGMAHRGRLNVLANIMGKSPRWIFAEFADAQDPAHHGQGDVKYHLGYSTDWRTAVGHEVHLSLTFNASHLEFVAPIVIGRVRAKQDNHGDDRRERGLALVIHGDAAIAGQGVNQEVLNMSQLPGYVIGGTVHIVVNNQVGFTTPPEWARSTAYCTDVAKMLQSPIFHVNGEDPEAVAQVVKLAMDFRAVFKRDVFIDMYCYRKRGHNEGDEPSYTQPLMYKAIAKRKPVYESFLQNLLSHGTITRQEADDLLNERRTYLENEFVVAKTEGQIKPPDTLGGIWQGFNAGTEFNARNVVTGADKDRLKSLIRQMCRFPEGFKLHPKLEKVIEARLEMADEKRPLDWATAEALAFATLATEGHHIRLAGQDVGRGTFTHRHAVFHDYDTAAIHCPLQHLTENQGRVELHNSPLSEVGVVGFEYGYSLDTPNGLTLWEAQFGDFGNVAQVIIDQFIVSAEEKWRRLSGLVMLLPHGYEGAGPEHSSARLERFLTLACNENIQVCNLTTPAQYYHVLRRQVLRKWPKPLIIMAPKSLLRHPQVVSSLDEVATGTFHRWLPDPRPPQGKPARVLACTGKIYYDLLAEREARNAWDVEILRIEQLYSLPDSVLEEAFGKYEAGTPIHWVQEEPWNMGSFRYLRTRVSDMILGKLPLKGYTRPQSASPACGSGNRHKWEQKRIMAMAFGEDISWQV